MKGQTSSLSASSFSLAVLVMACMANPQFVVAQLAVSRDPQAVAVVGRALAALTGGTVVSDATLTAQANWTVGSDVEGGAGTLKARGYTDASILLELSGGFRREARLDVAGDWSGPDNEHHAVALHNEWTAASWFFPALVLNGAYTRSDLSLAYVGQEAFNGSTVQHIRVWRIIMGQSPGTGELIEQLSAMDLYIDAATYLPQAFTFNVHPDEDATQDLPVEIDFSDYRNVNGINVPFRIRKSLQRDLVLDISVSVVTVNSGLTDSDFQLP